MRLLLDTHTFIWCSIDRDKLSPKVSNIILEDAHGLFLSLASVWEMQIKIQLGKLRFELPLAEILSAQQAVNGIQLLSIDLPHIWALERLPHHHRDPFDRLLIAQAQNEGLTLVSADRVFGLYYVNLLW
jgi:PIN domain nuclease of toxin-antitoxin system